MRTDLEKSLYSLSQIAGLLGILYVLITMFFLRDKLSTIFTNLSEIYKACKNHSAILLNNHFNSFVPAFHMEFHLNLDENDDLFRFLSRANNKSERMWKTYIKFVVAAPIAVFCLGLGSVVFSWLFIGQLKYNYFAYPVKLM